MHNSESMNADEFNARSRGAKKSTLVSVAVNILLSLFQITVGVFSGSQGLIADGIHSLSDLVADFVVLIASIKSRQLPDSDHHYGHWRYENGASMILGALLFLVGVGMLWSAVGKVLHPETVPVVHVIALWVALGALAAKELLFRYMLAVATRIKSSLLIANAWHARSDAASSLVVATGIIGNLMGHPYCDPIAALIVGVLVARMGYTFAFNALHDLMDRSVDPVTEHAIRETLLVTPGVAGLHDLKTRKSGDLILVDVHIEVPGELSVIAGHDIAVDAHNRVLTRHNVLNVMIHIDPCEPGENHLASFTLSDREKV